MIAIIDYDAGNLKSVEKALAAVGQESVITRDFQTILSADKVILPGVGAFSDAMHNLKKYDLDQVIREVAEKKIPLLGICLGLQLLFEESEESPGVEGLHLLDGKILRIPDKEGLKIPHIGWNALHFAKPSGLFKYINQSDCVYFVHSYYATDCDDSVIATTEYGKEMTAAVELGNIKGCQFHPEKSGKVGLAILKAFCEG